MKPIRDDNSRIGVGVCLDALAEVDRSPNLGDDWSESDLARSSSPSASMVEQIAGAIAKADGARFEDDPTRFRRLALAALKPLARPTEAMVDAAHEAVWFDAYWAINSRADFRKAVRAMIKAASNE